MESQIVEAVGSSNSSRHGNLSTRIEKAMADAIKDALAQGIPMEDSDTLRARQLAARDAVKEEFRLGK